MEEAVIRQGECFVKMFDKNDQIYCGKCGIKRFCEAEWRKKQAGEPYHTFEDYEFTTGLDDKSMGGCGEGDYKKESSFKTFLDKLASLFREKEVEEPIPVSDPKTGKPTGKFVKAYLFSSGPVHMKVVHSEYYNAVKVELSRGNIEKYACSCNDLDDEAQFKKFLSQVDKELKK